MGIRDVNPLLPSNRLIYEIRLDRALRERFERDPEAVLAEYGLGEEERRAWRTRDLRRLAELGVHPYLIPQTSRLFYGSAHNTNESEAARRYRSALVEGG